MGKRSEGFLSVYALFHLGAVIGVFIVNNVWTLLGGKKEAIPLFILLLLISLLLSRRISDDKSLTELKKIERGNRRRASLISLLIISLASGISHFLILKSMNTILGPTPNNYGLYTVASLLTVTLGSSLSLRVRWLCYDSYLKYVAHLLLVSYILFCISINLIPGLSDYANIFSVGGSELIYLTKMVMLYGPIMLLFSFTVPLVGQKIEYSEGEILFFNGIGLCCGLALANICLHEQLTIGQLLIAILSIVFVTSMILTRPLGLRWWLLSVTLLPIAFTLHNENVFSYSFRYFQSYSAYRNAKDNIEQVETFKKNGSELSIHHYKNGRETMVIDGYQTISIDKKSNHYRSESLLGLLQSSLVAKKDNALVIGLGSGVTVEAVATQFGKVTSVEVNAAVLESQSRFESFRRMGGRQGNISTVHGDGYAFLLASESKYDLIVNNVPTPQYSPAANIWTHEFLKLVKKRLTTGGGLSTWFNSNMNESATLVLLKTISEVFENCYVAVLSPRYFNLVCLDEAGSRQRTQAYSELIDLDEIDNMVIKVESIKALNDKKINSLNEPYLLKEIDYRLDKVYAETNDWFYFEFFSFNQQELERFCQFAVKNKEKLQFDTVPDNCSYGRSDDTVSL